MPYISKDLKDRTLNASGISLRESVDTFKVLPEKYSSEEIEGVLNYTITKILLYGYGGTWRYFKIARAMGTLICVGLEFYRRIAVPYEDQAIAKNGDIYGE